MRKKEKYVITNINETQRNTANRKRQNLQDIVDITPKAGLALGFSNHVTRTILF